MKTNQMLYTPTDWNKECELLKEYCMNSLNKLNIFDMKKEILSAIIALALFKRYTTIPRTLEVSYSLLFWMQIVTLIFGIYMSIKQF